MANIASVTYAIEGSKELLQKINEAISAAVDSKDNRYELYKAAEYLGLPIVKNITRLGGEIDEKSELLDGVLRFHSEERWGLQDFAGLLEQYFHDIKVYWIVEEPGLEVFCTNDKEGKYFPERYLVDACFNSIDYYEYFETEEQIYKWLDKITHGEIKTENDVERYNDNASNSNLDRYIYIHKFEVTEDY